MADRSVTLGGVDLRCSHCSGTGFVERSALLNTRGLTWLGMDWLNEGARVFACTACGHLEWFAAASSALEAEPTSTPCLSCGAEMPAGVARCAACGWTYETAGAGA